MLGLYLKKNLYCKQQKITCKLLKRMEWAGSSRAKSSRVRLYLLKRQTAKYLNVYTAGNTSIKNKLISVVNHLYTRDDG